MTKIYWTEEKANQQKQELIRSIDMAKNLDSALQISGELRGDAHHNRMIYIQDVFGSRSTQGFFVASRKNVTEKFKKAWISRNGGIQNHV